MKFIDYLKEVKILLILVFQIVLIVNVVIFLDPYLSKSIESLLYINLLTFISIGSFLVIDYINHNKKINRFIDAINNRDTFHKLDDNYTYKEIVKIIKKYEEETTSLKNDLEEINDYMTKWVHEVKIPIAVLEIISKRVYEVQNDNTLSKEITTEINRINKLVEQALYSSRASNYNSDFLIAEVSLNTIVKDVIRKNKYQFIYNKISLNTKDLNKTVLTDKKWISHIVELIIDNAIKYSPTHGKIDIYLEENKKGVELHIRDYGMGIPSEDIERVFDKGFTGKNGRKKTKSTGMGLYISKKILNKLSHDIHVISNVNEFCDVYITFYKLSDYFNVT